MRSTLRNAQDASAPSPSDALPALNECQLSVLRRVGREWDRVNGDPEVWREAFYQAKRHVFLEEKSGDQKMCMGFLVHAEEMEKLNNDRN